MIIEATKRHVLRVASRLEPVLRDACAQRGIDPRLEMLRLMQMSAVSRAWMHKGECLGIGGVVGTLLSSEGFIWLSLAPEARRHPMLVIKYARIALDEILALGFRRLSAAICAEPARDARFAEFLGFRVGPAIERNGMAMRDAMLETERQETRPFLIYALPRSRTAWMSNYLTYGGWTCHHDRSITLANFDDAVRMLRTPRTGSAETAAAPAWHLLHEAIADLRAVVVKRPVDQVLASMRRLEGAGIGRYDFARLERTFNHLDRCLDRIARQPGVLRLDYHELDREDAGRRLFEHCLPFAFDRDWWLANRDRNRQIDVADQQRYALAHRPRIEAFKRECRTLLRSSVRARKQRMI